MNEFLKNSANKLLDILVKLFNLIIDNGIFPSAWTIGVIRPIFKNKGNRENPNNYRGITILSCFGKLFTNILNRRLNNFLDNADVIGNEQAGFRKGYSTNDHIFTLYSLIEILLRHKKRLYCAFLDLEKAFDKVNRTFLWQKLFACGVNGKFLKLITNLYQSAKSCVLVENSYSNYFKINCGVRQGENLSPTLFALFLNDMKSFLEPSMNGLSTLRDEMARHNLNDVNSNHILKLFLLLYADDSVIFAEKPEELQLGLNLANEYCGKWNLKLNPQKCKIVIFSRGKVRKFPNFTIGNHDIEVMPSFSYLGIKFNYNNKMTIPQKDIVDRASRAMFALIKKAKCKNIPLDTMLFLFNKTIIPILTYGSEIWGGGDLEVIDKLQLKFLKIIFRLRNSTPSLMILGETGQLPVSVIIKSRFLNYWFNLSFNKNSNKLSVLIYDYIYKMHNLGFESTYCSNVYNLLIQVGQPGLWLTNELYDYSWFKCYVKNTLGDLYIQQWYNTLREKSVYSNYVTFKNDFLMEPYIKILPISCAIAFFRFRTTNNNVPLNKLRYLNIPKDDRICLKCDMNEIGTEFHYLFVCPSFKESRSKYIPLSYYNRPNEGSYYNLMNSKSKNVLLNLKHFIDIINSEFK